MKSTTLETDTDHLVRRLRMYGSRADRVIVYCRSLDMCADLYEHFHCSLGESSYYPIRSNQVSDNRLFGMYHANTPPHNKDIIQSLQKEDGVVSVVFATMALGMGINFELSIPSTIMEPQGVLTIICRRVGVLVEVGHKPNQLCIGGRLMHLSRVY